MISQKSSIFVTDMISKAQIKLIKSLEQKKFRRQENIFVAEGYKLVGDLLEVAFSHNASSGFMPPVYLCATQSWFDNNAMWVRQLREKGIHIDNVSEQELSRASLLQHPQQVLALFPIPHRDIPSPAQSRDRLILVLDGVQDPGNLGTICRLADWFGIEDIICSHETADIYNPKAVQATMGAVSRVRIHYTDLVGFLTEAHDDNIPIYGTFLDGDNMYERTITNNGIIIMGNEGKGISETVAPLVNERLYIPNYPADRPSSESLNVGVATAIICAEFRRRG